MLRHHSLTLLLALLSAACSATPNSAPEGDGSRAMREARVVDSTEEWASVLSAYDGTTHARHKVEPLLEAVPRLEYPLKPDFRASHGPFGGEALIERTAAVVRYSMFWHQGGVAPAQLDHQDAAMLCEGVDRLAFYALYDDAGHLTHLVETDAWLIGNVESEWRIEWSENRPSRCEWLTPYDGGWRIDRFAWDDAGRLLQIVSESDDKPIRTTHFEYVSGYLRSIRVQVGEDLLEETVIQRGLDRRISRMDWASLETVRGPTERQRTVHYHYPAPGQVQRINVTREHWSGFHWMQTPAGIEMTCSFNSGTKADVEGLWLTRSAYREGVQHVERGFVALKSLPVPSKGIDASLLFDSPLKNRESHPITLFWPGPPPATASPRRTDFVLERDERGNWLKVGDIDPQTGELRVNYERTIEYL